MKKSWLTSLTVAGIVGSAGAAYAGVSVIQSASAESAPATSAATATPESRTVTYQIGLAGLVTLTTDGTTLTVADAVAGSGWTLVGTTPAGAHVEVQFTDGAQLVTFLADAAGEDITVSVTNVPAPDAVDPGAPADMPITIITVAHQDDEQDDEQDDSGSHDSGSHGGTIAPPTASSVSGSHDDDDEHEEEHDGEHEDEQDDD